MQRILVVDDEPSVTKALRFGLSSEEVEVDVADDGKTGVELAARKDYDVIIADMCLPDTNALDVIQRIKTRSPDIVSILITADPERDGFAKAKCEEITACFEKPVDLKSVKDAIKRGFRERDLKRRPIQA